MKQEEIQYPPGPTKTFHTAGKKKNQWYETEYTSFIIHEMIMSPLCSCPCVLQRAGLLRLPQCERSLPADLRSVGRPGSYDPETQRGSAGEEGWKRFGPWRVIDLTSKFFFLNLCPSCCCLDFGAEIMTHLEMKVFSSTARDIIFDLQGFSSWLWESL